MPPYDERFVGQPLAVHLRSFYEDQLDRKEDIERQLRNGSMGHASRIKLMVALKSIKELLDDVEEKTGSTQDPLAVYWESEIAAGREPDLNMTLKDLRRLGRV